MNESNISCISLKTWYLNAICFISRNVIETYTPYSRNYINYINNISHMHVMRGIQNKLIERI